MLFWHQGAPIPIQFSLGVLTMINIESAWTAFAKYGNKLSSQSLVGSAIIALIIVATANYVWHIDK